MMRQNVVDRLIIDVAILLDHFIQEHLANLGIIALLAYLNQRLVLDAEKYIELVRRKRQCTLLA